MFRIFIVAETNRTARRNGKRDVFGLVQIYRRDLKYNTLYLADLNRHLVADDPQSGQELWSGTYGDNIIDKAGIHNAGVRSLEVVP